MSNDDYTTLRSHLLSEQRDDELAVKKIDFMAEIEHILFGSTSAKTDNPWIPYSILAGEPIESVNQSRQEHSKEIPYGGFIIASTYVNMSIKYRVFYKIQSADEDTGEIPLIEVFEVRDDSDGIVPEEIWKNETYRKITKSKEIFLAHILNLRS